MTRTYLRRKWLLGVFALLFLSGCAHPDEPAVEIATQILPTAASSSSSEKEVVDQQIDDMVGQMTLDEKIGQMTQVERLCINDGAIRKYFIGSVFSGGGSSPAPNDPQAWVNMIAEFQEEALSTRMGIPVIYGLDSIHGIGTLYGATIFPQEVGLGATRDAELVYQIGQATAKEMAAIGTRWNFSPVVAVPQDIRWGRTYESYSEDTALAAELGAAFIKGMQSIPSSVEAAEGQSIFILATPKHFLGDGGTTFGTSTIRYGYANPDQVYLLDQGDMQLPEETVRELFLPPYRSAVEAGAKSVMASFSSWNGEKMHGQKLWLTDILKGELGFEGFIVSDYGGIAQVEFDYYSSVVTSINAGIDMSMVPCDYREFIDTVKQAVK